MSRAKTLRSSFATLRLYGPDQKGIVAACSHALDTFGFGIVQSETWTDRMEDLFFQRMLFCKHDHENKHGVVHSAHSHDDDRRIGISNSNSNSNRQTLFHPEQKMAVNGKMNELKEHFGLDCMRVNWRTKPKKIAVFVSKYDHCLVSEEYAYTHTRIGYCIKSINSNDSCIILCHICFSFCLFLNSSKKWEILLRHQAKELDCEIKVVLSNHKTLKPIVETFGIPFRYFPITPENKRDQERKEIELLKNELDVDFVVLARYMQILSSQFLAAFAHDQIINIHHSFLPAFIGRSPYHQVRMEMCKYLRMLYVLNKRLCFVNSLFPFNS